MDPVSIVGLTAAIGSLLAKTVSISTLLYTINTSWGNAPVSFKHFDAEVRAVRTALSSFEEILMTRENCLERSLIPQEIIFQEIRLLSDTMSDLENRLQELLAGTEPGAKFKLSQRLSYLWRESEIKEFLEHFRAHKESLLIHMTGLNNEDSTIMRTDMQDIKAMIAILVSSQKKHVELTRKRELEFELGHPYGSVTSSKTDYTQFNFDQALLATAVYRRFNLLKEGRHTGGQVDAVQEDDGERVSISNTDFQTSCPRNANQTTIESESLGAYSVSGWNDSTLVETSGPPVPDKDRPFRTVRGILVQPAMHTAQREDHSNDWASYRDNSLRRQSLSTIGTASQASIKVIKECNCFLCLGQNSPDHQLQSSRSLRALPRRWGSLEKQKSKLRKVKSLKTEKPSLHLDTRAGSDDLDSPAKVSPGILSKISAKLGFRSAPDPRLDESYEIDPFTMSWLLAARTIKSEGIPKYDVESKTAYSEQFDSESPYAEQFDREPKAIHHATGMLGSQNLPAELDAWEDLTPAVLPEKVLHSTCHELEGPIYYELDSTEIYELEAPSQVSNQAGIKRTKSGPRNAAAIEARKKYVKDKLEQLEERLRRDEMLKREEEDTKEKMDEERAEETTEVTMEEAQLWDSLPPQVNSPFIIQGPLRLFSEKSSLGFFFSLGLWDSMALYT